MFTCIIITEFSKYHKLLELATIPFHKVTTGDHENFEGPLNISLQTHKTCAIHEDDYASLFTLQHIGQK